MLSSRTESCRGASSDTAIHGIQSTELLRKKRQSGRSLDSASGFKGWLLADCQRVTRGEPAEWRMCTVLGGCSEDMGC